MVGWSGGVSLSVLLLFCHRHYPLVGSVCGHRYLIFSCLPGFFLGFVVVCTTLAITGRRVRPMNYHYLLGRTVANSVAVFFFYRAVAVGSVAQANILNMTYPLFVALFSWFLIKEQRDPVALPIVGLACAGVYLVLAPGLASVEWNNLWGLGSGDYGGGGDDVSQPQQAVSRFTDNFVLHVRARLALHAAFLSPLDSPADCDGVVFFAELFGGRGDRAISADLWLFVRHRIGGLDHLIGPDPAGRYAGNGAGG